MKLKSKIAYVLLLSFIVLQAFRPTRNTGTDLSDDVRKQFNITPEVEQQLRSSCFDCHSNNTVYPWYTNIQPVGLWMQNHVNHGKEELNFSELNTYAQKKLNHKLEEITEMINKDEMPLTSYILIHSNARLNQQQKDLIINWANQQRTIINHSEK